MRLLLRTSDCQDDKGTLRMEWLLLRMSSKPGWQKDAPQDVVIRNTSRMKLVTIKDRLLRRMLKGIFRRSGKSLQG
mgnify:FL=1